MKKSILIKTLAFTILAILSLVATCPAEDAENYQPVTQVIEEKGLKVEFSIDPISYIPGEALALTEHDFADVRFRITDASTGAPVSPLEPAVWIDPLKKTTGAPECTERLKRYTQGTLSFQAAVDLNKFFILVMNNDQTISVIDPILGISGYSQLYAMIRLQSPAADWVFGPAQKQLYVTMPKVGRIAVVSMDDFKVTRTIETGTDPMRIVMQPDNRYLWIANDATQASDSGVTVVDPLSNEKVAFIPTGSGHHDIVFTDDSLFAFVSNRDAGKVSVIDVQKMTKVRDVPVGGTPVSMLFSKLSQSVLVGSSENGEIVTIDRDAREKGGSIPTSPGLSGMHLTPDGRWLFAVNEPAGRVDVIDLANRSVAYNLAIPLQPFHVAFTDTYAYIRTRGSADVNLVRLADLGKNVTLTMQQVVVGNKSPEQTARPVYADSISPTGEWGTVVISNPLDKRVYYYMEGMVAPMGTFNTYGRTPLAVTVVDRSLRETEKGVYTARIRIPSKGEHSVAFLIDTPWIDNCFSFNAAPDPEMEKERSRPRPKIVHLSELRDNPVGQKVVLRFAVQWDGENAPEVPPTVIAMATRPPGNWQIRKTVEASEAGIYELELVPDADGIYLVSFSIPEWHVDFTEIPYFVFKAVAANSLVDKENAYVTAN